MLGANIRFNVWRMNAGTDDYAGGASITGTVVLSNIPGRIQANPDEQFILQQGLETIRTSTVTVDRGNLDIRERDEIQVTFPVNYPHYNHRFRIVSVRYTDLSDPRWYMILEVQRIVRAHTEQ